MATEVDNHPLRSSLAWWLYGKMASPPPGKPLEQSDLQREFRLNNDRLQIVGHDAPSIPLNFSGPAQFCVWARVDGEMIVRKIKITVEVE